MKAISLWQPWATLLTCGAKRYETRSWKRTYRGPIAIHAALKKPPEQEGLDWEVFNAITNALTNYYGAWRFDWHLGGTKINPDGTDNGFDIPLGAVIATAELVGCHKIVLHGGRGLSSTSLGWLETDDGRIYEPTEQELLFGNWTPGRYAWEFANMIMLPEPIPAKGHQGLWNWEPPEVSHG
jgi:hypothetical protein